jgi:hypothetical protein
MQLELKLPNLEPRAVVSAVLQACPSLFFVLIAETIYIKSGRNKQIG